MVKVTYMRQDHKFRTEINVADTEAYQALITALPHHETLNEDIELSPRKHPTTVTLFTTLPKEIKGNTDAIKEAQTQQTSLVKQFLQEHHITLAPEQGLER